MVITVAIAGATILNAANIVTDFSSSDNPNGPYQYGYKATLDGPLTLLSESFGFPNVSPFIGWYRYQPWDVADLPSVTVQAPELDYIYLHPFTDPLPFAVLRYTVPVAGMYTVTGAFSGRCCATTDVHLLFNDAPAISGTVTGYLGPPQNTLSFSLTRLLMANDTIDFAVGDGGNGYCCDSTGVRATIVSGSDIPEPGPASLVLGGLVALLCRSVCRSGARRCRAESGDGARLPAPNVLVPGVEAPERSEAEQRRAADAGGSGLGQNSHRFRHSAAA